MQSRIKNLVESVVVLAIFAVLIQTFLEDYAVLAGWSWGMRKILIFTGLGFDLFFSIEFLIRFITAAMIEYSIPFIMIYVLKCNIKQNVNEQFSFISRLIGSTEKSCSVPAFFSQTIST